MTKFFNDLGDDKKEDGFAVWSSFVDSLKLFKSEFPTVSKATLFSDGAGCYSGAYLAVNLCVVGKLTGIFIIAHYVSEAGKGKSILDANFGTLMNHVRRVIDAGLSDVHYAQHLNAALGMLGGVKGNTAKELVLDRERCFCFTHFIITFLSTIHLESVCLPV